ncbi:BQ5605_C006g04176 [Microbotryum silenes-dioicae]|uniref:ATP-dependent DNA helicase n=1 Tax=Microbotryum silenes-dioicae TaxID=796604 RepID=A0A2X0M669_9BASI|nr:BQ5605_C006g04176 [Microbotryum silenes-dioicae]
MQHSYEFEDSLQHVLFECQLSSCFFTMDNSKSTDSCNEACQKTGSGHVNCGSPSRGRSSTARFGGVTVVLAGDPRQRLPVIPKSSSTQIVDFVDAPGGTGKTFLEETVLARIRSEGTYALAVASSGIAAQLLPKGSTAHLRFKIPNDIFDDSRCNVPKQGQFAELWDEAPMQHRRCFQLVDRMLQNVGSSTARFGGLTVVLAGSERMPSRYSTARFGGVTVVLAENRLWSRELRLTIPWQILNVSVRWGDHHVGKKSEAMPSRYSTARFGGVTVVLAGDPRQRLPVIPKSSSTQIVDFVDAPGGTGKTFLEETVLARIRSEGTYALAVASSGIAAQLLPKGSTAHLRFKIPNDIFDDSRCNVPKQGQFAELWDEAPMQHRRCFQLVDRMLQHVRSSTARVGGLTAVLADAFPQFPSHRLLKSSTLASWNTDFWGEVEVLLDFLRLKIRVIGTLNVSLHCHCYRWTTARILIVARHLGGLKASNDEGLERPTPDANAIPQRRPTVRNLRERVQFAHGDIPPPHSHRLHCVHCREPTLDMT